MLRRTRSEEPPVFLILFLIGLMLLGPLLKSLGVGRKHDAGVGVVSAYHLTAAAYVAPTNCAVVEGTPTRFTYACKAAEYCTFSESFRQAYDLPLPSRPGNLRWCRIAGDAVLLECGGMFCEARDRRRGLFSPARVTASEPPPAAPSTGSPP